MEPALQTCRPCRRRECGNVHKPAVALQQVSYITPMVGLGRQHVGLLRDLRFPCRGSSSFTAPTNQLRTNYTQTCKGQYRFTAPTDGNYTERWYGSMPTTSPKECMPVHDCNTMNCKDNHNSTALTTHQSTCRRGPQKLGKNY